MSDSSISFATLVIMLFVARSEVMTQPPNHFVWWAWMFCQSLMLMLMAWHVVEEFKRIPMEVLDGRYPSTAA